MIIPRPDGHKGPRKRALVNHGAELFRQYIYMPGRTWEALDRLAAQYETNGSNIITRLIEIASTPAQETRQA